MYIAEIKVLSKISCQKKAERRSKYYKRQHLRDFAITIFRENFSVFTQERKSIFTYHNRHNLQGRIYMSHSAKARNTHLHKDLENKKQVLLLQKGKRTGARREGRGKGGRPGGWLGNWPLHHLGNWGYQVRRYNLSDPSILRDIYIDSYLMKLWESRSYEFGRQKVKYLDIWPAFRSRFFTGCYVSTSLRDQNVRS